MARGAISGQYQAPLASSNKRGSVAVLGGKSSKAKASVLQITIFGCWVAVGLIVAENAEPKAAKRASNSRVSRLFIG